MTIKQFPTHVTIPTPLHTPLQRGTGPKLINALNVLGENVRVRINVIDHKRMKEYADSMGLSGRAEFMRWCAIKVMDELDKEPTDAE